MATDVYEDTLFGQILPLDCDEDSVSGIILLVDGEEEFIVEPDDNGEILAGHIERWVTAEGVVLEDEDELRIKVRYYTLEDEIDYDADDDW
ncbi:MULTISPECIES: hypothetical protein [unclassified Pseudodesulfovibrio]|uniref:hypothetical protein n=1 Tax=unclassified Pseudodesulfovibrio TaxID=2661612 RepID=UPI000FEB8937|nr:MULTISPECIES: hypothetical protein [unclassified Pseudodesulfovibrio]MCJ2164560.1 hypothetical protein [Pseudodesulfovibrio sp. S3-i]RWU04758.1 hypothetical protein DWB63_08390 [Pseudodesulfovibrio sp. S3]